MQGGPISKLCAWATFRSHSCAEAIAVEAFIGVEGCPLLGFIQLGRQAITSSPT